jgi:hypothetical protein
MVRIRAARVEPDSACAKASRLALNARELLPVVDDQVDRVFSPNGT